MNVFVIQAPNLIWPGKGLSLSALILFSEKNIDYVAPIRSYVCPAPLAIYTTGSIK